MKHKVSLLIGLVLLIAPWFIEPADYPKFCGEVTYQNSTYDKHGRPSYWLELTDQKTKEIRQFRVTGSAMAANELGVSACFNYRVVKLERLLVFLVLFFSGVGLVIRVILKN